MTTANNVLAGLADALGGEGWDDPRLEATLDGWVDLALSTQENVDLLIDQSFDPRDMLEYQE